MSESVQLHKEWMRYREVELLTPVVKDEPKKWRWREVSSSRFELRFDGDRSAFAIANDCGDHWAMQCIEIGGAAKTKVDAFSAVERQLRASKDWREGDEIEPCREPVPTLALWLSRQDIYVDCDRVFTVVGFTGLPLADVRKAHAAITEYFEKYPDAEPEFRKEWEGK